MYTDEEIKINNITKCDVCRENIKAEELSKIKCILCMVGDGDMLKKLKKRTKVQWIHIKCVKWFMNNVKIEMENGFRLFAETTPSLPTDYILDNCTLCSNKTTLKIRCAGKCEMVLHLNCIPQDWISEVNSILLPKFKFLNYRCDACAEKKRAPDKLDVKTYGKDLNNFGDGLTGIK
jgi:hypothetical protein